MAFACHAQVDGIDNLEPPNRNPVQCPVQAETPADRLARLHVFAVVIGQHEMS